MKRRNDSQGGRRRRGMGSTALSEAWPNRPITLYVTRLPRARPSDMFGPVTLAARPVARARSAGRWSDEDKGGMAPCRALLPSPRRRRWLYVA